MSYFIFITSFFISIIALKAVLPSTVDPRQRFNLGTENCRCTERRTL